MVKIYPSVTLAVKYLAHDSYGNHSDFFLKPVSEWDMPGNIDLIESQASALTRDELLTLACGEDSEQQAIRKKHNCEDFHEFLCQVFDGDLHYAFFKDIDPSEWPWE